MMPRRSLRIQNKSAVKREVIIIDDDDDDDNSYPEPPEQQRRDTRYRLLSSHCVQFALKDRSTLFEDVTLMVARYSCGDFFFSLCHPSPVLPNMSFYASSVDYSLLQRCTNTTTIGLFYLVASLAETGQWEHRRLPREVDVQPLFERVEHLAHARHLNLRMETDAQHLCRLYGAQILDM